VCEFKTNLPPLNIYLQHNGEGELTFNLQLDYELGQLIGLKGA